MTELEAINGAKKGDYKSQRFLYDKYKTKWYMICMRYMSYKADADDALQNGMINVFSKIDQFNPELGYFSSWSSRILVNDCIMLIRKKKKALLTDDITDNHVIFDERETAVEALSRKEMMALVQKLPDGYRTVFNMYVIEGYSHKEIADKLKISEGTSKSQLFKARKLLKETLEVII